MAGDSAAGMRRSPSVSASVLRFAGIRRGGMRGQSSQALRREPLTSGGSRRGDSRGHRGTAGPDAGRDCSGDAQTEDTRKPHGAVSVSGASRRHIKKKSFALRNRSGRTWLAPAGGGYASRACLIPPTLSSLMRVCCRAAEGVQHELMPSLSCAKDGDGPPEIGVQERVSNQSELLR